MCNMQEHFAMIMRQDAHLTFKWKLDFGNYDTCASLHICYCKNMLDVLWCTGFFLHTCHPILNPLIGWRELQSTNVRHSFFIKPPVVFQLTWYKIRYCKVLPQHSNFSTHNQCGKLEDFRENEFHESHSHGRYEMRQFEENQAWYTTPGSVFLPGLSTGKYILQHDYRKPMSLYHL